MTADLARALEGDRRLRSLIRILLTDAGFQAVALYRLSSWLVRLNVPLLPHLVCRFALWLTGAEVRPLARFDAGLRIAHSCGIVVGDGVVGGRNCTLLQNVTLGEKLSSADDHRYPQLGSDVTICAGAVVLGAVRIGDGAIVGANSVVTKHVPAGALACGVPAVARWRAVRETTGIPSGR